ncbi:MAG: hypothetical protein OHK0057_05570 [Thermoflexibacter sp.]
MKKLLPYLGFFTVILTSAFLFFYKKTTKGNWLPDESRFSKIVLADSLSEPMELAVMRSGKVIFLERKGKVKLYDPQTDKVKTIAEFNVFSRFNDGMLGIALDPQFDRNGWVYIYYSPNDTIPRNRLSRFLMVEQDSLLMSSEKVILEVPVQRQSCCHAAGSLAFDKNGLLYLSTGDNTSSFESDGYSPTDERPNRSPFDAQGSSANTNDLRGKILRIRPMPDGTYTIPAGNLFPKGSKKGRPEIYVMGCRNPFRFSIDNKNGFLYWGDIGPDAGKDGLQGPQGYDEVNRTDKAGFFGWPYFIGDNKAYKKYNFENQQIGESYNPFRPVNYSPNNTGDTLLPPAQPAWIWYPYGESKEFPFLGKGGRNAMAGVVYYADEYENSPRKLPKYYDGKVFIYEWMRDWIIALTLDEKKQLKKAEPFLPTIKFDHVIDMAMGKDGTVYLLEYGQTWYSNNPDARLVRIEYAHGNRSPIARAEADKTVGNVPLTVQFSGKNSVDYDKDDALIYEWFVGEQSFAQSEKATYTFKEEGIYQVKLKVKDKEGKSHEQSIEIVAGNSPPQISVNLQGNQSFYFGKEEIPYQVQVTDKEDKEIHLENLKINFDYQAINALQGNAKDGLSLIEKNTCKSCHAIDKKSVGPAFIEVAKRYDNNEQTIQMLINKIRKGGNGNWGEQNMSAFPDLPENELRAMLNYILGLNKKQENLPREGILALNQHRANEQGKYTLSITYTDKGTPKTKKLTSQQTWTWQFPKLEAELYDQANQAQKQNVHTPSYQFVHQLKDGSWLMFKNIDLQGVKKVTLRMASTGEGYTMQIRVGKPDGQIIGELKVPNKEKRDNWEEFTVPIANPSSGKQDLYLIFSHAEKEAKHYCSMDWIEFSN